MEKIVFEYNGRQHSGQLISSTNMEPHYHWVYFSDETITRLINDDCIGFKKKGNGLQPTKVISNHQELIETVKRIVESRIN
jgi:hypothetical protein